MPSKRRIRVFISSPSDVPNERQAVIDLIDSLNESKDIGAEYELSVYDWKDTTPPIVGQPPQQTVNEFTGTPDRTDIVVCIFGRRYGSALYLGGKDYGSGTYYEFSKAAKAFRYTRSGKPVILLYRIDKDKEEAIPIDNPEDPKQHDIFIQYERVKEFFKKFTGHDALYKGLFTECSPNEFSPIIKRDLKTVLVNKFPIAPVAETPKQDILGKVRSYWIDGVLNNSTGRVAAAFEIPIRLDSGERFNSLEGRSNSQTLFTNPLYSLFENYHEQLVILGKPGTGKTFAMLELVSTLLEQTEQANENTDSKIPVVFNLSGWAAERMPFDQWLVSQLKDVYRVPEKIAEGWVGSYQLCLCLDGLDEITIGGSKINDDVSEEQRIESQNCRRLCLQAINSYINRWPNNSIILCCREEEYRSLDVKLKCRSDVPSVLLEPLDSEQVEAYLETSESKEDLCELKAAIQKNKVLREMARTPFLLTTMAVAYRDENRVTREQILSIGQEKATEEEQWEAYRDHLLSKYISTRFDGSGLIYQDPLSQPENKSLLKRWFAKFIFRHKDGNHYDDNEDVSVSGVLGYHLYDIQKYLGVLAQKMQEGRSKQLLVEHLQPTWLSAPHRVGYVALTASFLFAFITFVVALPVGAALGYERSYTSSSTPNGILYGLMCFGISCLLSGGAVALGYFLTTSWRFGVALGIALGLTRGVVIGLSSVPPCGLQEGVVKGLTTTVIGISILAPLLGIKEHDRDKIKPIENRKWDWRKAMVGLVAAFLVGMIFWWLFDPARGWAFGLALVPILMILFGNFSTGLEVKVEANQGIWQSLYTALRMAFFCAFFGMGCFGICYGVLLHDRNQGIVNGILGLACSVFALGLGVMPVVQHASLRIVLTKKQLTPFDYVHFLDSCCKIQLLRKVGGSYIFHHEELRKFFLEHYQGM